VAKLLGIISPKRSIKNVITHVAIPTATASSIPEFLAILIDICVASAAVNTFTRLFPTRIVIRSLSVF